VDADRAGREQIGQPIRPLDDRDPIVRKCVVEAEVGGFPRIVDAVEVEVFDGRIPVVTLSEDERGTRDGSIAAMQRPDERSNEGGFARTKATAQRHGIAWTQRRGRLFGDRVEGGAVEKIEDVRGHALPFDERILVLVRPSDVLVGIIAGAVCAVVSAAFEGGILAFRFFSIDHLGGHFGSDIAIVALAGAAIGGIVAFGAEALFLREPATP
jgi:hypothetical protein